MTLMSDRAGGLLLTGASGFVGQSVLARWLARTDRPVTVLVRAADDDAAFARVAALLGEETMRARRAPLHALAADVTDFDPDAVVARAAAASAGPIDQVIHAAACVRFDQTLEEARAVNVAGTQRMLALARRLHADHPLRRYVQVSTAYVAGTHGGGFGERDRRIGQRFRNSYEESKIEAEELVVGAALDGLPVQVVRRSSSGTASRAGPQRSTCSTCRCAPWSPALSTPCPSRIAGCSMSCRSTTSPTGCWGCRTPPPTAAPTT
jgi:long-chain acyl-CoA synthetase